MLYLKECQRARSFAKHPSKVPCHPATNINLADFHLYNSSPDMMLFQPHLSIVVSTNMPHKDAYECLTAYFEGDPAKSNVDEFCQVWDDFVTPWFGLPSDWNSENSDSALRLDKGSTVKCKLFFDGL